MDYGYFFLRVGDGSAIRFLALCRRGAAETASRLHVGLMGLTAHEDVEGVGEAECGPRDEVIYSLRDERIS